MSYDSCSLMRPFPADPSRIRIFLIVWSTREYRTAVFNPRVALQPPQQAEERLREPSTAYDRRTPTRCFFNVLENDGKGVEGEERSSDAGKLHLFHPLRWRLTKYLSSKNPAPSNGRTRKEFDNYRSSMDASNIAMKNNNFPEERQSVYQLDC